MHVPKSLLLKPTCKKFSDTMVIAAIIGPLYTSYIQPEPNVKPI